MILKGERKPGGLVGNEEFYVVARSEVDTSLGASLPAGTASTAIRACAQLL